MPCYRPLKGYRSRKVNPDTGKRSIVWNPREGFYDLPVTINCGQCIGCRLERSRSWAMRCVLEAKEYEDNCFITLTYNDKNIPNGLTLHYPHFQEFMRRLRSRFGAGIKFYMCGEYGKKHQRPHYHACIFNFDFPNQSLAPIRKRRRTDPDLFIAPSLQELWPYGFSSIGRVTFESAAYVARYITKKKFGAKAEEHYCCKKPEFTQSSNGLGKKYFQKYTSDIYPSDFIVLRGIKLKPPKYYDRLYEISYPSDFKKIQNRRKHTANYLSLKEHYTRLAVKEEVHQIKARQLIRSYEDEN